MAVDPKRRAAKAARRKRRLAERKPGPMTLTNVKVVNGKLLGWKV